LQDGNSGKLPSSNFKERANSRLAILVTI
jgi:hypothetical protein